MTYQDWKTERQYRDTAEIAKFKVQDGEDFDRDDYEAWEAAQTQRQDREDSLNAARAKIFRELEANVTLLEDSDRQFAESLIEQMHRRGSLSPKQGKWVEVLHDRALGMEEEAKEESVNVDEIVALFDHAKQNLKWPKIKLDGEEHFVQFSMAGDRAKFPGTINVTDGQPYGMNTWYGRIHRDGRWEMPRGGVPSAIQEIVKRFAKDPAGVAGEYGKASGCCVFCHQKLTDDRSVFVGYGPVCAGNYELPWGTEELKNGDAERIS